MDNLQPLLLTESNDGEDWHGLNLTKEQVMKRHGKTYLGSQFIGEYSEQIIDENVKKGNIL